MSDRVQEMSAADCALREAWVAGASFAALAARFGGAPRLIEARLKRLRTAGQIVRDVAHPADPARDARIVALWNDLGRRRSKAEIAREVGVPWQNVHDALRRAAAAGQAVRDIAPPRAQTGRRVRHVQPARRLAPAADPAATPARVAGIPVTVRRVMGMAITLPRVSLLEARP